MTSFPVSSHSHSLASIRGRKADAGRGNNCLGPTFCFDFNETKGQYWLTNARMVRYQSMLCENLQVKLEVVWTLNPVTLLPLTAGPPDHDCSEVINEVFSIHPDLCDQPLPQSDLKLFTDDSSFLK
jgi:hypothetical protein